MEQICENDYSIHVALKSGARGLCECNLKNKCFAKCETILSFPSTRSTSLSSRLELSEREDLREDWADCSGEESEVETSFNLSFSFFLSSASEERRDPVLLSLSVSLCCVVCEVFSPGWDFGPSDGWDFFSSDWIGPLSSDGWGIILVDGWEFFSSLRCVLFFVVCWDFFSSWCVVCNVCTFQWIGK